MSVLYTRICDDVRTGKPFALSRFGDGEWNCILGKPGQNCDGHRYFPDLGERLGGILRSHPKYMIGMQPFAEGIMGDEIRRWLKENKCEDLQWVNADVLHDASKRERLKNLFSGLTRRKVILVGPSWTNEFPYCCDRVVVATRGCWMGYADILSRTLDRANPGNVILVCCGMAGKVLVDDLSKMLYDQLTVLDCGSVLDYYCGVLSRRYMVGMAKQDGLTNVRMGGSCV